LLSNNKVSARIRELQTVVAERVITAEELPSGSAHLRRLDI
jgi:hypothetical protein